MAAIRLLQRIGNFDAAAMRQVAKQLMQGAFPFDRNRTAGVIMYGLAAEVGDVQSLMALGWMVFYGEHGECDDR
jgi:TPR repeat protein